MSGPHPVRVVTKLLQFVGVFPVTIPNNNGKQQQSTNKVLFSKKLACATAFQIVLISFRSNGYYQIFKGSKVSILTTILFVAEMANGSSALVLVLSRLPQLQQCLLTAHTMLDRPLPWRMNCVVYINFICLFTYLTIQLSIIMFSVTLVQHMYLLAQTINNLMSMSVYSCLILLLAIILRSYSDINQQIEHVANHKSPNVTFSVNQVMDLADHHWAVGDLLDHVHQTFSPTILMAVSYYLLRLVLVIYYTFVHNWDFITTSKYANWALVCQSVSNIVGTLVNLLVLCAMAEAPRNEGKRTLSLLHRLLRRKEEVMDQSTQKQVRVFQLQVRSRRLQLTGCDFFVLDRSLFYGMVMQVISCFILLVQFQPFQ